MGVCYYYFVAKNLVLKAFNKAFWYTKSIFDQNQILKFFVILLVLF